MSKTYDVTAPDGKVYEVTAPDGATQEEVLAYAKSQFAQAKPQGDGLLDKMARTRARNAEIIKSMGDGNGLGQFAYDLGGKVTDLTKSPVAGGITNFVANAIPAMLTSGRMADVPAASLTEGPAKWLMQTAVKPSTSLHSPQEIKSAMGTMLKENIYPTPGGMEKAGRIVGELNKKVDAAVAASPETVKVADIASRLNDPMKKFGMQMNPQSDAAALEDVWTKFLTNPHIQGKAEIPVNLAHQLKKGTYSALGGKSYGELGSASIEGQKALARGAREEVAGKVPSMVETLKREADIMNVRDVAMLKALQQGNNNPLGLAALRMDHLPSATLTMADRIAAIRAFLAMQMYGAGKTQTLAPLGTSLGILSNQPQGVLSDY